MRLIKLLAYCSLLALAIISCIKPFEPEIAGEDQALFVVSGQLTDQEGYQYVDISLSSDVNKPAFIPVTGCDAEIQDDQGRVYPMEEIKTGGYRVWMQAADLVPGRSYRIRIATYTGPVIMSYFDTMPDCPEVDSIYYEIDEVPTNDPEKPVLGIRFFADLDARGFDSRYFRWEIEETWEYQMDYGREWYYDGISHKIDPVDNSTRVCWQTTLVSEIFTVSTSNLAENVYRQHPLHFVNNRTTRLTHLYSPLIRQYAISEEAYAYWDKLRINSEAQGGLYEQQPLPVDGNLYVPEDENIRVLGFFGAASVTSKRLFVGYVPGLEIDPNPLCIGPVPLGIFGWADVDPTDYPVYFTRIDGAIHILMEDCLDCRMHGGDIVKPDFWP